MTIRFNALLLCTVLFFIVCFPGLALADGTPNHQTLRCGSGECDTRSTNEASMTDNDLQGDLLTLRYVELDKALAWLWGANPKVHDGDGLLAFIQIA